MAVVYCVTRKPVFGVSETGLYSRRIWLEARNLGFRKKRDCTIYVVKQTSEHSHVNMTPTFIYIRGLSQKVVDFLYNKKTIRSIATKFCMQILPLFLHYHANFEGKMSNNKVCALILPTVGLSHWCTSYKL